MKSATINMQSVLDHQGSIVQAYGPIHNGRTTPPAVHYRFGIISKGHNSGKFRLMTDHFFPMNQSVNDDIDAELCTFTPSYAATLGSWHA